MIITREDLMVWSEGEKQSLFAWLRIHGIRHDEVFEVEVTSDKQIRATGSFGNIDQEIAIKVVPPRRVREAMGFQ